MLQLCLFTAPTSGLVDYAFYHRPAPSSQSLVASTTFLQLYLFNKEENRSKIRSWSQILLQDHKGVGRGGQPDIDPVCRLAYGIVRISKDIKVYSSPFELAIYNNNFPSSLNHPPSRLISHISFIVPSWRNCNS